MSDHQFETSDTLTVVGLNRPGLCNAMTLAMWCDADAIINAAANTWDYAERRRDFAGKRPPRFTGR